MQGNVKVGEIVAVLDVGGISGSVSVPRRVDRLVLTTLVMKEQECKM